MRIYSSDGTVWEKAVAVVWDVYEVEGKYRAFWAESPDGNIGVTVIGYCSPGGCHRTIKKVVAEFKRSYPNEPIYRNGKRLA